MFIIRLGKMLSMNECFQVKNSFGKNLTVLHMRFQFAQGLVEVFFFKCK